MNQMKLRKTYMALLLSVSLVAQVSANEQNVAGDIPVAPMNTDRIPVMAPPAVDGKVASAIDQAMMEAVAKSLPTEAVQTAKGVSEGKVDLYGRPINGNAIGLNPALMQGVPQVKTEVAPPPLTLPGTTAANRVAPSTPIPAIAPQVAGRDPVIDKVRKNYKPHQQVKLKPGHSELIPVATGLQNRISTEFTQVEVKTSDGEVPIDLQGGFIYITPMSQAPIGLMIGEAGMPETMVNLTLMPLDVPPVMVEVDVLMPGKMKREHQAFLAEQNKITAKERRLEEIRQGPVAVNDPRTNSKHVDRATSILAEVAGGEIPQGFDLVDVIPEKDRYPCDIRRMAMYHEVGQRLVSGRELIDVVRVKNDINGFREIREEFCLDEDVIAVGVFDRATLAPGEDAELYILRDKLHMEKKQKIRARPRLTTTN